MARFRGFVDGYDPQLRLQLRALPEGGSLLNQVYEIWRAGIVPIRQNELLVLVHGFNNHEGEAEEAYKAQRSRQVARLDKSVSTQALDDLLGDLFWPGDAAWPGPVDWFDFLIYSHAVGVAKDAAIKLVEYIRTKPGLLVVHFLGHSLGCRLVLETIKQLLDASGPQIGQVCLMAAAVPTFKTCPGGDLYDALGATKSLLVLFSPGDWVLRGAFPPGQTIASGDEGFFPAAVGLNGDVPLHPGLIARQEIVGARHGDYWGTGAGAPSDASADAVAGFFSFGRTGSRVLASRPMSATRAGATARQVGD